MGVSSTRTYRIRITRSHDTRLFTAFGQIQGTNEMGDGSCRIFFQRRWYKYYYIEQKVERPHVQVILLLQVPELVRSTFSILGEFDCCLRLVS
jgi:hypothetical protein